MNRLDQVNKDIKLLEQERERLLKPPTYQVGDILVRSGYAYMICKATEHDVILTCLIGTRGFRPIFQLISVENMHSITREELSLEGFDPTLYEVKRNVTISIKEN